MLGFGILSLFGVLAPIAAAWFVGEKLRDRDWSRWLSLIVAVLVLIAGYVIFLPAVTALDQAKCWRSGLNGEELQTCLEGDDEDSSPE
jgi:H+/Cl- antiporter ClcA